MKKNLSAVVLVALVFSVLTAWGGEFLSDTNCVGESVSSPLYYPSYDLSFSKPYTFSGSDYMLCPGNTMHIGNLKTYIAVCGDGRVNNLTHGLVAWVYQGNSKLKTSYNYLGPAQRVERSQVIGTSSSNLCVHLYGASPISNSMDIYTFNIPGVYTVYLDYIRSFCGTYNLRSFPIGCPWLGGFRRSTTQCGTKEGWVPQKTYSIKVPGPILKITPPLNVSGVTGSSYPLTWVITNAGIGKMTIRMKPNCVGFSCSFVGYTANSTLTLDQGASYTLVMNLDILGSSRTGLVGVGVAYDDAYGLACIASVNMCNYILVTIPGDDADYVHQSVPNPMCVGESYTASVTMKNTGNITWSEINGYRLGSQNPQDNTVWGTRRAYLDTGESITPGSLKTFSFKVTAPWTPGTYDFQWMMVREFVTWFGQKTVDQGIQVQLCNGSTTTTTIAGSSSTTTTSSTTTIPRTVTFSYRVKDDKGIISCSLWTNISDSGDWGITKTRTDIVNNEINRFSITHVKPGLYRWNVECIDTAGRSIYAWNSMPKGYWVFKIN